MVEFAYNNAKNANTGYTPFKLNYGYHPYISYKEDINLCFKSKLANKLSSEVQELILICRENLYHAQEL